MTTKLAKADIQLSESTNSLRSSSFARIKETFGKAPVLAALFVMTVIVLASVFANLLWTVDPEYMETAQRLKDSSSTYWLGTDAYGRDLYSRILYGGRVSLTVGLGAALFSVVIGAILGVVAGYFRLLGAIIMRVMDGLMAIPNIMLAIALVSLAGGSLTTVLVAITIPEVPRVVRLVHGIILSVKREAYVEAALTLGTKTAVSMWRHMLPNAIAPLIVQGTYIFAAAMITESVLSFLGAGIPPGIPSWGNIMAEGRMYFQLKPALILYAGIVLSLTVLSINILGDALRDALDPKLARNTDE